MCIRDSLNTLNIKEGRLPEKKGEILVEYGSVGSSDYKIGDKVVFGSESGESKMCIRDRISINNLSVKEDKMEANIISIVRSWFDKSRDWQKDADIAI